MKKFFLLFAGVLGISGLFVFSQADAQSPPKVAKPGNSFEQRLAQRKDERKIRLDERDGQRLESKCVEAQNSIRALQQKTSTVLNNRNSVYQRVDAKLWIITGQLKLAEKDTFNLEKQRSKYVSSISKFQSAGNQYRQVLDDLTIINCQADPAGFKALLESARIYQNQLRNQSENIKSQVVNELKTALSKHATGMQPKPSTEE
jgi:hypothetical protein